MKELNVLKSFEHPNIIKYFGHILENDYLYIFMEYATGN